MWRERRHETVFADFGDLGRGISGVRLARALRNLSTTVRIFLLSDAVDQAQRLWARANGATDVVRRQADVIAQCLSPLEWLPPQPPEGGIVPHLSQDTRPHQLFVMPQRQRSAEDMSWGRS